ncbi:tRNA methyltransferase 10 B [Schistosoma haematobium]|uniref:tRNA methyltransferase 10 B n=1 Tax=Schistosoma haematobium TaxID=6185 RepID=A0A922LI85_SCHHA|nr:tRNA methyltransferase 10 B [Schistosoma haematobium]KAH9585487.1 tRNA methyltransferase 10 B [Schistosoma haematobium]
MFPIDSCQKRYRRILQRKKERRKQEKVRRKIASRNKIREDIELNRYHSKKFLKNEVSNRLQIALYEGIRIYIDCSYEALMSPKECNKFAQQLCRLYGANKKATKPLSINLVNFSQHGPLFHACQSKCDGFLKYKGRSRQEAENQGYRAVRLPIEEFTSGKISNPVLAINHVIDIMLAYMANGGDWKEALYSKLPGRFLR